MPVSDRQYDKRTPANRARKQLRDVQNATLESLRAFDKAYQDGTQDARLRKAHQERIARILQQGSNPHQSSRHRRSKNPEPWTAPLLWKLIWALGIAVFTLLVADKFGWLGLVMPAMGLVVSRPVYWSVIVPALLVCLLVVFLLLL
jgi:hypothetical protein